MPHITVVLLFLFLKGMENTNTPNYIFERRENPFIYHVPPQSTAYFILTTQENKFCLRLMTFQQIEDSEFKFMVCGLIYYILYIYFIKKCHFLRKDCFVSSSMLLF
jgi:hypothetical protein